ncbi:MAG TPA: hypothetical protein V6D47_09120, partial [Oscillatoriaceae cyanobacterium]
MESFLDAMADPHAAPRADTALSGEGVDPSETLAAIAACQSEVLAALPAFSSDPDRLRAIARELALRTSQLQMEAIAGSYARRLRALAHDLRSPIGVVCGALNVIEAGEGERLGVQARRML